MRQAADRVKPDAELDSPTLEARVELLARDGLPAPGTRVVQRRAGGEGGRPRAKGGRCVRHPRVGVAAVLWRTAQRRRCRTISWRRAHHLHRTAGAIVV